MASGWIAGTALTGADRAIKYNPGHRMIAVVIPSYRLGDLVLPVLEAIGPEVDRVFVVDDACPMETGSLVEERCNDSRVRVLKHETNQGVGGATLTGFEAALEEGADFIVKLDGDGQMDPRWVPHLLAPLIAGEADYAKGNRFYDLDGLRAMPSVRLMGNAVLSFMSKLSSGYWNLFDPTNGFTAINATVARTLPFDKISRRWFFESDLLFRLGISRAVVAEVPMPAVYEGAPSSLNVAGVVPVFAWRHTRNTFKRIFYSYYLRNFNMASIELLLGVALMAFGVIHGLWNWSQSEVGELATSGTVMLAALPVILGTQLLLSFFGFDLANVPDKVISRRLGAMK